MRLQQAAIKISAMLCLVGLMVALAPSQASAGWRRRTVVYSTSEVVGPDGTVTTVYTAPATTVVPSRVVYPAPVQEVFAAPTTTVVNAPVRAVYTPTTTTTVLPTTTTTVVQPAVVPTTYVAPAYVRRGLFGPRIVYPRTVYVVP
jgi:hypothetical protein